MAKRFVAIMALMLFILCGCGPENAAPTPSPSSSPAVTATPEPTSTLEATPAPTPTPSPSSPVSKPNESALTAKHAFVYNCSSGQLLYTLGDQNERIAPASLAKLFTCIVALEYLDENTVVTVGEEATWIQEGSSIAAVYPGHQITVEMLVEGMLLQSGNDAAYALAIATGRAIAGDPDAEARSALDAFMAEMNVQAQKYGLTGTHFTSPEGWDDSEQYTTPADLLTIAKLAMEVPVITRYSGLHRDYAVYESGHEVVWLNTNMLLNPESEFYCEQAIGLKTGTTGSAGNCLISAFQDNGSTLLIGVFGCPEKSGRYSDALLLYNHYRDHVPF